MSTYINTLIASLHLLRSNLRRRPWLGVFCGFCLFSLCAPALLYVFTAFRIIGQVPSEQEISNHQNLEAARVYSIDGVLLGTYHIENRTSVSLDSVPDFLIDALLATEDHRFRSHTGIDMMAIFRVIGKTIMLMDESSGGGSTISQQLAKSWYPRIDHSAVGLVVSKFSEMATARIIEHHYSKEEILEMYLNSVSFGEDVYGVQAAALRYFSKTCAQLAPEESALLVGMLKAPTRYHPLHHPIAATARRNTVLAQMVGHGAVRREISDSLSHLPLRTAYNRTTHHEGLAPHFREHLRADLKRWCRRYEEIHRVPLNVYQSGLIITTSIHAGMQTYAEQALKDQLSLLQEKFNQHWEGYNKRAISQGFVDELIDHYGPVGGWIQEGLSRDSIYSRLSRRAAQSAFTWTRTSAAVSVMDSIIMDAFTLQAGLLAMDPESGHIRAWVGGIDHAYSAFDQVKAPRQTGSVFKPILYAAALEQGVDPCIYISNEREIYEEYQDWNPRNSDNFYGGQYSMEGALAHSVNVVSARLIMKTGIQPVLDLAKRMGISRELPPYPAIALGAGDISLLDMVSAFSTLANEGTYKQPRFLLRIEDRKGNILADYSAPNPGTRVLDQQTAIMITEMLQGVIDQGTGRALRKHHQLKLSLAGKTGTTQNQRDGWFIAYHPSLVVGARVGAQDPRIHWRSLRLGQGAATALPIVGYFLQATTDDPEFSFMDQVRFPPLTEEVRQSLDCADFTFPMGMTEFKLWWRARSAADSLRRLGMTVPDSIKQLLQNDWTE